ncbi:MAG TPA: tetratricopeptide repeat protein [Chthoniobacterales bacterium]|jgi:serine/threonine-protein kinase
MNPRNFFAELKRRNVYKVAVAYVVVSWLLLQAASIFLPAFDAPSWVMKVLIILLLFGFPIALALSWAFEITPDGIKLESEIAPNESITRRTGRKIIGLTIALAVIAAGLFAFQFFRAHSKEFRPPPATASVPEKSIAVLPFDNLSHDPDNAYFSEGIQDEILTRLAKSAELKVVSRTSTERFKSSPSSVHDIAEQLGVANILEGSVQKENNEARVNVQLIKAATDTHLWAETYDRKLTDIFAVESEIARSVAGTLQAKLTGSAEHVLASRPTDNPEAHQLYLRGRYFWNRRTLENLKKAIGYFDQAIEKDPSYALAYAGLADSYSLMPVYGNNPPKEDIARALTAAHRALELDDSLAEAHTSLGNALEVDFQFAAAEREFKRAIYLNPNYATAHQWFGECLQAQGRFAEALAQLRQAHELDPLSLIINSVLGSNLGTAGQLDEAVEQFRKTLEIDSNFGPAQFMLGEVLEDKGDLKGAKAAYGKGAMMGRTPMRQAMIARMDVMTGQREEGRKILEGLTNSSEPRGAQPYPLALIYLAFGEKEKALRLLEQAYDERSIQLGGNTGSLKIDPRLDPLRGDPRFEKLLARYMGQTK